MEAILIMLWLMSIQFGVIIYLLSEIKKQIR
jgi:hypothetical protein